MRRRRARRWRCPPTSCGSRWVSRPRTIWSPISSRPSRPFRLTEQMTDSGRRLDRQRAAVRGRDRDGVEPSPHLQRLDVPIGVERAAAWGWRVLVIALASYVIYRVLSYFSDITVPVAVAVLLTALGMPFVDWLARARVPRVLATLLVLLLGVAVIVGILTLVGQQIAAQIDDLRSSVAGGVGKVQDWLRDGPLGLSDEQLSA